VTNVWADPQSALRYPYQGFRVLNGDQFNFMFVLTYFTLPAATTTLSDMSNWFNPWFAELWPFASIALGIVAVGFFISIIFSAFRH